LPASASAKPKAFRRTRVGVASLIAVGLAALVATLMVYWSVGQRLELTVSDRLRAFRSLADEAPGAESVPITLILIDDAALERVGRWPWPWTRMADIIDALADLEARLIVLDIEFPEPDPPHVVETIGPDGKRRETIVRAVPQFVESVREAGNLLIPFSVYFKGRPGAVGALRPATAAGDGPPNVAVPEYLVRHVVPHEGELPAPHPPLVEGFTPMIPDLAAACAGSGFTSFPAPDPGGVVRRVPMLAWGSRLFPHLMLEAAGYWRFGPDYRVALAGGTLRLSAPDGRDSVSVPVEGGGWLELRWPTRLSALRALPVLPLLALAEKRRQCRAAAAELAAAFPDEGWAAAAKALDEARARAGSGAAGAPPPCDLRSMARRVAEIEERLAMDLAEYVADPQRAAPAVRDKLKPDTANTYIDLFRTYHEDAGRLRKEVAGRLCVVGAYATGVAELDLHATPLGDNQPGVTVYPAGIRTILSGVAFLRAAPWEGWLLAVAAAWLAGALASRLPTGWGIVAAVGVSAAVLAAARMAVAADPPILLPVAGPILAVVVAFAGVSAYRQLTEASGRRWITRVFQQYTSAEHVDAILRQPQILRLGGERCEVTVLFSDIAGFTPLSERLAPDALVALLNRYLSAMTDVLLAQKATLDKYEGDGILAFFGAPVAAPDHALRAVRAALAMQAALPQVNDDLVRDGILPQGTRLAMRIGCSTGQAIVGNFGSHQRFDYTVMGDTVNLGGRLEEANRWLGTSILVPDTTRAACGAAVLFRRLGLARIRGKAQPVPLYEPLAAEPAPAHLAAVAAAFGRAVDALAARDVPGAEKALADLLAAAPADGPAQALKARLEAIRNNQAAPDEPWNLARPK
jgi:class 3 adenylate cyclase